MSNPSHIQDQKSNPQQQSYYIQYPQQQMPYYTSYPVNQYAVQSTQQASYHYHFPQLTTPFKIPPSTTNNTHHQTAPINQANQSQIPIQSEQHNKHNNHNIQSNNIVNHNTHQHNTFNPTLQAEGIIIADDQQQQQQQQPYDNHSNSESTTTTLTVTLDTDPIAYLDTHDIIQRPVMRDLIKRSSGTLTQTSLKIAGLCVIGNHLWLKENNRSRRIFKENNKTIFKKIQALKFQEWMEWIKNQLHYFIDIWKQQICSVHSAKDVLENIIKKHKKQNRGLMLSTHKNDLFIICIVKYKSRLMSFIHAFRKLYGFQYKKELKLQLKKSKAKSKSKSKSKLKSKLKLKTQEKCWRCGKSNHHFKDCHSRTDIHRNRLSETITTLEFKRVEENSCWRCGKGNHRYNTCRSKQDINGNALSNELITLQFRPNKTGKNDHDHTHDMMHHENTNMITPTPTCWRCGKGNHRYPNCHSIKDINGKFLSKELITLRFKPDNKDNIDPNNMRMSSERTLLHQQNEMLPSCLKCGYFHCRCHANSNEYKRKFADTFHDGSEPVFKKQKLDDNLNDSKQIQIQIKTEPTYSSDYYREDTLNTQVNNVAAAVVSCSNCNKDLKGQDMWRCSRCKISFYCDRQCQLNHWTTHKIECGQSIIKLEKIAVSEWTHYGVVYWLNRVNDGMFCGVKYKNLRKHIVIGKIKGCDLLSINKVTLRMMGIDDLEEQNAILNAMSDIVLNGNFNNVLANRMKINDIPMKYIDPALYEIMDEPVEVMQSRYIYDKKFIVKYIEENKSDPMTERYTDLSDLIECKELLMDIEKWKQQYLIPI